MAMDPEVMEKLAEGVYSTLQERLNFSQDIHRNAAAIGRYADANAYSKETCRQVVREVARQVRELDHAATTTVSKRRRASSSLPSPKG